MAGLQTVASCDILLGQASKFIDDGRYRAASPLLSAARALAPEAPGIALLDARLRIQTNDLANAATDLDTAIAITPLDAALFKCRSGLRQRVGDYEGAARDAAEAVCIDPADRESKLLLGQAMMGLGRMSDSIGCLASALKAEPNDPRCRQALATALDGDGDSDAALRILDEGICLCPSHLPMRNAAILLCMRRRDYTAAARRAEQARISGIADASTFGMAGHALASLGEHAKAAAAFREASKLCPEDESLRELAATSQQRPNEKLAAASYIRLMFDGYADRFESHILSLRYRIPVAIRNLLLDHPKIAAGGHVGPVLDLGCGTGLVALALGGVAVGPFTGIDLAPGMLAHAKAKGLYDELVQEDAVAALSNEYRRWPLIIAADVVCYFSALDEIFRLARKCLDDEGWFIFSVERLVDSANPRSGAWSAVRHGRYAHSDHYIYETARAAGFQILHNERCGIRQEAGEDVSGLLVIAQRAFHDTNGPGDD